MPNPRGNPENLQPLTTNRPEPLTAKLTVRVPQSMMNELKTLENYPEFVRQAIQEALDKRNLNNQDT
ncbi:MULTISPECIES: hypothetical protein [Fischerella]|uniref:Uncharacterized protein n=1 Tax=Fischerella muscicola CCMEE 5323 TaxID=2019572 RepID=A0A2N6K7R4_FISMU|nr:MULTISPECIES: hypothetical protein [Fischerella]MBD2431824.1 hypothetical protein [Fischerella sp. FACHB-380]PLZ93451.1 hypothetical protein CEN44_03205 [Fischerella muscicola CCMEE 5323]